MISIDLDDKLNSFLDLISDGQRCKLNWDVSFSALVMKNDIVRILLNIHATILSLITSLAETTGFPLEKLPILYASYPITIQIANISNSNNY